GTDMSGGPLSDSIVLDFTTHFNTILEIQGLTLNSRLNLEMAGYGVLEPGVFYRDFEKETLKKNLLLPSYPASREICTVGGMVANNAGGEKSLKYGKTEKYVQELSLVLSDGNEYAFKNLNIQELEQKKSQDNFEGRIYREMHNLLEINYDLIQKARPNVSKNSAGYALWNIYDRKKFDLTQLFTGSQGTLGLLTKIKFRLVKPLKHSKLLVIFLKDLKMLGQLVNLINDHNPESMESYDDNTIRLVFKILPDLIKKVGIGVLFRFVPDLWNIFTNGMPKMVMIIEFADDDGQTAKGKVQMAKHDIESKFKIKTRVATSWADAQKYWTIRRESFNLLRKHIKGRKTAPFIDDIIVRPEKLPEFLPKLDEILNRYKDYMIYTIAGHPGDGNFHIIPLMDLSDEKSRRIIPEVAGKVYDLVLSYGGSITAEHNDGLIRTPYLEKMYGWEIVKLFQEVKKIFDPQNIFNPGKKVAGNIEYAMKHIKTNF
ncbi:MAG: FAD-binding oxidoreductase, partial [Patescibacteria group bacterium]